jgi:hypothetical protein
MDPLDGYGLGMGELAGLRQPVVEVVDHDHPAGAHQPRRLRREEPDGRAPNTTTTSPSAMSPNCAPK